MLLDPVRLRGTYVLEVFVDIQNCRDELVLLVIIFLENDRLPCAILCLSIPREPIAEIAVAEKPRSIRTGTVIVSSCQKGI